MSKKKDIWLSTRDQVMGIVNNSTQPMGWASTASLDARALQYARLDQDIYIASTPIVCPWCRSKFIEDRRGNCAACGGPAHA